MKPESILVRVPLTFALACLPPIEAAAAGFVDPINAPAVQSPLAAKSLLQGVARAGDRLVAVGQRGHIVHSNDGGATWKQASVPVSSDLTAVFFANDKKGWAVGHDGVILTTDDGGANWSLQLDGLRANDLALAYIEQKAKASPDSPALKELLAEAQRNKELGADKPFLDVWFADANNGYVVGAYNLIFRTSDGGKTWQPLMDMTENPKFLNLYAIRPAGGALTIAGEGGLVLRQDPATQQFKAVKTPYAGSYFGVTGDKNSALVFGLRGNAYRTEDGGKTWAKVDAGLAATIVAASTTEKNETVLADMGGRLAISSDGGRTFKPLTLPKSMILAGIADAGNGRVALVGPRGVAVETPAAR